MASPTASCRPALHPCRRDSRMSAPATSMLRSQRNTGSLGGPRLDRVIHIFTIRAHTLCIHVCLMILAVGIVIIVVDTPPGQLCNEPWVREEGRVGCLRAWGAGRKPPPSDCRHEEAYLRAVQTGDQVHAGKLINRCQRISASFCNAVGERYRKPEPLTILRLA